MLNPSLVMIRLANAQLRITGVAMLSDWLRYWGRRTDGAKAYAVQLGRLLTLH
jgi:hypothetical protein